MKKTLKTLLVCTAAILITSCGPEADGQKRNIESTSSENGFDFSFDLTSSDSKKLVDPINNVPCVESNMKSNEHDESSGLLSCDDLFEEYSPKVLVKVTLKTKYKNKWNKKEKTVALGYEGAVVFKNIKRGSQGLKISLSLVDIIHGTPEVCGLPGALPGGSAGASGSAARISHKPECDYPLPFPREVEPNTGFSVHEDLDFTFKDTDDSKNPGIPGAVGDGVRNIKAKAN